MNCFVALDCVHDAEHAEYVIVYSCDTRIKIVMLELFQTEVLVKAGGKGFLDVLVEDLPVEQTFVLLWDYRGTPHVSCRDYSAKSPCLSTHHKTRSPDFLGPYCI